MSNSAPSHSLQSILATANVPTKLIDAVLDSGYFMRRWVDPFTGRQWQSVSDKMYGNKQFSSSFPIEDFIRYLRNDYTFPQLPSFVTFDVKSVDEILAILADPRRTRYIAEGSLTFRGQPNSYRFRRQVPNPVRRDVDGYELSILPGVYRQSSEPYSFAKKPSETRCFTQLLRELEPNNPDVFIDSFSEYDVMRTEQHYATQTMGLDLAFEIDTAIFFATHKFKWNKLGQAFYEAVPAGEHQGVIYCLRFTDPPVNRTRYLIKDFDLFKTLTPLRILRQDCGLPLISSEERNIAITDINCIIRLHPEFHLPEGLLKTPEYMFPCAREDSFYSKLLSVKDRAPDELNNLVEYEWARK